MPQHSDPSRPLHPPPSLFQSSSSTTHTSRPRTPSPDRDPSWVDIDSLAPREPGLPLYLARSSQKPMSAVEIVDSSAARRRGGGPLIEGQAALGGEVEQEYDGGKGEKQTGQWPVQGIGMESRYAPPPQQAAFDGSGAMGAPTKREFAPRGKDDKWAKMIPARKETWVSAASAASRWLDLPTCHFGTWSRQLIVPLHPAQLEFAKEELLPHLPLVVYTFLSLFTRLYRIGAANSVVWDEVGTHGCTYTCHSPHTFHSTGSLRQVWCLLPQPHLLLRCSSRMLRPSLPPLTPR